MRTAAAAVRSLDLYLSFKVFVFIWVTLKVYLVAENLILLAWPGLRVKSPYYILNIILMILDLRYKKMLTFIFLSVLLLTFIVAVKKTLRYSSVFFYNRTRVQSFMPQFRNL